MIDPDFAPGSLGCHEALHMASYFAGAVDEELCEHPAIKGNPEWRVLAIRAVDAIGDLYNAIGREHLSVGDVVLNQGNGGDCLATSAVTPAAEE